VRNGSELMHDGPYLQVVLPGVLPPDWDTLRRDVESAIDDGATRVTVIASDRVGSETDDGRLEAMVDSLKSEGVEVVVFRQGARASATCSFRGDPRRPWGMIT
jgi:hypothetical protein